MTRLGEVIRASPESGKSCDLLFLTIQPRLISIHDAFEQSENLGVEFEVFRFHNGIPPLVAEIVN